MMGETLCELIKPEDGKLSLLQRKIGHRKREDALPQIFAHHVPVSGNQLLQIRGAKINIVFNSTPYGISISQLKVTLSDPHQANLDLEHPDSNHDNREKDTFEIDSMEDLDEENYKNLRIEGPKSGIPFSLQPLESQVVTFKVVVKESLEFNFTLEIDLQLSMIWSFAGEKHVEISLFKLPSLRIRKPGMVMHAAPQEQPQCKKCFQMKYVITNYLQDFLSVKLLWLPEKALKDPQVVENQQKRQAVEHVMNAVLCHQPHTNLGALKMGATVSVLIDFTILAPGLFELGQHMKLNMQYSTTSEPAAMASKSVFTHTRHGSSSSTHSMPTDMAMHSDSPQQKGHRVQGSKSAGISPVSGSLMPQLLIDAERRKAMESSVQSMSSASTPTGGSPQKTASVTAAFPSPTFKRSKSALHGTFTACISRTPSTSSITSLSRTGQGSLSALQILKRNCQVLVSGNLSDESVKSC